MVLGHCTCFCDKCVEDHERSVHCMRWVIAEGVSSSPRAEPDSKLPYDKNDPLAQRFIPKKRLGATPTPRLDWEEIYRVAWEEMKAKVNDLHDLLDELNIEVVHAMAEEEE